MSRMFVKAIPATAGNVVFNLQPAAERRWKIHRFRVVLVCDATVVTRIIRTRLYDDSAIGNETGTAISGANCLATATTSFSAGPMALSTGAATADNAAVVINAPIVLDKLNTLSFEIINGVVGDSYSGYAVIEEEPSGS